MALPFGRLLPSFYGLTRPSDDARRWGEITVVDHRTMKDTPPITYPLRVQATRTPGQAPRLYVTCPMALAAAIGLEAGDEVQSELLDRAELHLMLGRTPEPQARSAGVDALSEAIMRARFAAGARNRGRLGPP